MTTKFEGLENVVVVEGDLHPDGWMSRKIKLIFETKVAASSIKIVVYNPDMSTKFIDNRLNVILNDSAVASLVMSPATCNQVILKGKLLTNGVNNLTIEVSGYLESDLLDPRERGTLLISAEPILPPKGMSDKIKRSINV
ncbi:hypothetical protein PQU92_06225 [Asticcacaulis sp. BYS171W]|uniref:Uncharacterized protein n=1 Tax=Asticcacaulis aquaticus TaxID=2984212 RepID=A0ABT5HS35_9CAUL|nr:hypothetical protein [Asticcacaulis aquaticus]MDC7682864.1 hypothetical protein [Asticcacaulis aquaticus]